MAGKSGLGGAQGPSESRQSIGGRSGGDGWSQWRLVADGQVLCWWGGSSPASSVLYRALQGRYLWTDTNLKGGQLTARLWPLPMEGTTSFQAAQVVIQWYLLRTDTKIIGRESTWKLEGTRCLQPEQ